MQAALEVPVRYLDIAPDEHLALAVSRLLLDPLDFSSLLDAGCGSNPKFPTYVIGNKNATYYGFDRYYQLGIPPYYEAMAMYERIKHLQPDPNNFFIADILNLPEVDKIPNTDIVHCCAVLAHNPPHLFEELIFSLLQKAKKKLLCIEFNWYSMLEIDHPLIRTFISLSERVNYHHKSMMDAGTRLLSLGNHYKLTQATKYRASLGDYRALITSMSSSGAMVARQHGDTTLEARLNELIRAAETTPIEFSPMEAVAVIIEP